MPPPIPYASVGTIPRLNPCAIAAMICGIISVLFPLLVPVALLLGWIALRQIRVRQERGKGFALAGITTGFVGILSAMMMGYGIYSARLRAQRVQSMANLRSLGQGIMMYASDNKGYLPGDLKTLAEARGGGYVGGAILFVRPGTNDTPAAAPGTPPAAWSGKLVPGSGNCSYTYVITQPTRIATIRGASNVVLMYETVPVNGYVNALFADGHVQSFTTAAWIPLRAKLPPPATLPAIER